MPTVVWMIFGTIGARHRPVEVHNVDRNFQVKNNYRRAAVVLLILVLAACIGAKVALKLATSRTTESYNAAKELLDSLSPEEADVLPPDGCPDRHLSFDGGGGFSETRGGYSEMGFNIGCGRNVEPLFAGRVAIIVRHGLWPTVKIRHSNTDGGREVAGKLLKLLQRKHKVEISPQILADDEQLTSFNMRSEFSHGFFRFVWRQSDYVIIASAAGLLICFVWWVIQKRRQAPGFYCRCGYDLRGSTGDRCSECGEEIPVQKG